MGEKVFLGLDNGGTTIKGALYDKEGKEIYLATQKIGMFSNIPGHTSRDSEQLWQANIKVMQDIVKNSGVSQEDIVGVGVTGHGNGLYLTKKDGTPAYNGIISTDSRGTKYSDQWLEDGTFDRVLPKTHQQVWHGQPTAILKWFLENKPEVLAETDYVFMCKDYVKFRLTGQPYGELTDMTATGLMDVENNTYDLDLLKEYGLESLIKKLPENKKATDVSGYITKDVAILTGLKEGTPVAGGMHDIHAMTLATGAVQDKVMSVIAGTWSINQIVQSTPVVSKNIFMCTAFPPNKYLVTEASPTSASNLEWFLQEILKDIELPDGQSIYDYSNHCVRETIPSEEDVIFLPFLYGSEQKSCFLGMKAWNTRAQLIRSVYEGIVFRHKHHIDYLTQFGGVDIEKIRLAGGVVNSKEWLQMFADILQKPIEVVKVQELGCLGAALCAGVASGVYKNIDDAVERSMHLNKMDTYLPNKENQDIYNKKYQNYREYENVLRPTWH